MDSNLNEKKFTGFFAMIDVLGFSEMILNNKPEDIRNIIVNVIGESAKGAGLVTNMGRSRYVKYSDSVVNYYPIEWIMFSDTILIYIETDSKEKSPINSVESALSSMCFFCSLLLNNGYRKNIAFRGAISYGDILISKNPLYYIGNAVIDAHKYEAMQDWSGIVLTKFAEQHLTDRCPRLIKYNVPFKNSNKEIMSLLKENDIPIEKSNMDLYAVNWKYEKFGESDFEKIFNHSIQPEVIEKKKNTVGFYNAVINNIFI